MELRKEKEIEYYNKKAEETRGEQFSADFDFWGLVKIFIV